MRKATNCLMCGIALFLLSPEARCSGEVPTLDRMILYYQTQDLANFEKLWEQTNQAHSMDGPREMKELLSGFLGAVFRKHPELLLSHIRSISIFPKKEHVPLAIIVWMADSNEGSQLLKEAGYDKLLTSRPPPIAKRHVYSVEDIDFLIGWFCGSGDRTALYPIAAELFKAGTPEKDLILEGKAVTSFHELYVADPAVLPVLEHCLFGPQLDDATRKKGRILIETVCDLTLHGRRAYGPN